MGPAGNRLDALDCLIIGGGPAGLAAGIYLGRFHLSALVVDAGGGRAAMIPKTRNLAGFPDGICGAELLSRMRAQVAEYGVAHETGSITSLAIGDDGIFVARTQRRSILARTVLLASGVSNRRPSIPAPLHAEAVHRGLIRYCPICDGYEMTDRRVAVISAGGSGLAEAEFLRSYTADVTLIVSEDDCQFTTKENATITAASIKLLPGPCLGVSIREAEIEVRLPATTAAFASLYVALGSTIRSELAADVGARVTKAGCPEVDRHQRTSVSGLYAAGDLVEGLDQISTAMGQAAVAATAIRNDLAALKPLRR